MHEVSRSHQEESISSSSASLEGARPLQAFSNSEQTRGGEKPQQEESTSHQLLREVQQRQLNSDATRREGESSGQESSTALQLFGDLQSRKNPEQASTGRPDEQEALVPTSIVLGRELREQQEAATTRTTENRREQPTSSGTSTETTSNRERVSQPAVETLRALWSSLGEHRSTIMRAIRLPESVRDRSRDINNTTFPERVTLSTYDALDLGKFHQKQEGKTCAIYSAYHFARSMGVEVSVKEVEQLARANGLANIKDGKIDGVKAENASMLIEKHLGIDVEFNRNTSFSDIEQALSEGKAVYASVNAGKLWNDSNHVGNDEYETNHAIIITGLIRDARSGKTVGVLINDSASDTPVRVVDIDQFQDAFALRKNGDQMVGKAIISKEKRPPFEVAYYQGKPLQAPTRANYTLAA